MIWFRRVRKLSKCFAFHNSIFPFESILIPIIWLLLICRRKWFLILTVPCTVYRVLNIECIYAFQRTSKIRSISDKQDSLLKHVKDVLTEFTEFGTHIIRFIIAMFAHQFSRLEKWFTFSFVFQLLNQPT